MQTQKSYYKVKNIQEISVRMSSTGMEYTLMMQGTYTKVNLRMGRNVKNEQSIKEMFECRPYTNSMVYEKMCGIDF